MSSSMSGQRTPSPWPMISKFSRCFLVACEQPLRRSVPARSLLALQFVPIDQLNRRRHDADERRALHRLEALAGARGHFVLLAAEVEDGAVRGLGVHAVDLVGDERAAEAGV